MPALDAVNAPSDNTTLNATTGTHGLLPKLSGSSGQYLDWTGGWSTPLSSGSGGSGSVVWNGSVWMPDARPSSTYSLSDEFDNASLSGSWVAFDPGGTINTDENVIGLHMNYNGTQFGAMGGVYIAHAMSDDYLTIWTKLSLAASEGGEAGIFLCQDVAGSPTTSDLVTLGVRRETDGSGTINLKYWTSYNQATPTVEATVAVPYHNPIYLSMVYFNDPRLSNCAYSFDGVAWEYIITDYTWGFVPQQFGLFDIAAVDLGGNEFSEAYFEFFRVKHDYLDNLRYGNRVNVKDA
jgi:hypothetical protein